jgi:eukaryotic-like serine/threonine-protein kinase
LHGGSPNRDAIIDVSMVRPCRAVRAAALALSALLTACAPGDRHTPADRDLRSVVVADFVNSTTDPIFEFALKHALALALDESTRLQVFDGVQVADSLRAMNRSADERLTADLAWEIAVREEIDALVLGSIDALDEGYAITIEAVASDDGATLIRETVRASGRDGVIDALGQAALKLYRGLGEPSAMPAASPLKARMTASLVALAHYAAGREHADRGRHALAGPHYCRALAVDPGFELARDALRLAAARSWTPYSPECAEAAARGHHTPGRNARSAEWGGACTTVLSSGGRFRFERSSPGRWQLGVGT